MINTKKFKKQSKFSELTASLKNKRSVMVRSSLRILLLTVFAFGGSLHAETFVWAPLQEEPSFSVDVPNDWSKDYTDKKQSAKVYFFLNDNQINVTTQLVPKNTSKEYLVSLASAELSARFDYLILKEKTKLAHREQVYLLSFLAGKQKQKFIVKMYLLTQENKNLTLVCIGKENKYEQDRVYFDNAAYSFDFSNAQRVIKPKPKQEVKPEKPKQTFSTYLNNVVDSAIHSQTEGKTKSIKKEETKKEKPKKPKTEKNKKSSQKQ